MDKSCKKPNQQQNIKQAYNSKYLKSDVLKNNIGFKTYTFHKRNKSKSKSKMVINLSPIKNSNRKSLESQNTLYDIFDMLPSENLNDLSVLFSIQQDLNSTLKTNFETQLQTTSKKPSILSSTSAKQFQQIKKQTIHQLKQFIPQKIAFQDITNKNDQIDTNQSEKSLQKSTKSQEQQKILEDQPVNDKILVSDFRIKQEKQIEQMQYQQNKILQSFEQSYEQNNFNFNDISINVNNDENRIQNSFNYSIKKTSLSPHLENKDYNSYNQDQIFQPEKQNSVQNIFTLKNGKNNNTQNNKKQKNQYKNKIKEKINFNTSSMISNYREKRQKRQRRTPIRIFVEKNEIHRHKIQQEMIQNKLKIQQRQKINKKQKVNILGFQANEILTSLNEKQYKLILPQQISQQFQIDSQDSKYVIYQLSKQHGIQLKQNSKSQIIDEQRIVLQNGIKYTLKNTYNRVERVNLDILI